MNVNAPVPDKSFVFVHLFCDSAHEFAPGINLHFRPFERPALVNLLKGLGDLISIKSQGFGLFVAAGNVNNGQRVFESFAGREGACCAAEKEGPPDGPCWALERRISAEKFASAQGGISARVLA